MVKKINEYKFFSIYSITNEALLQRFFAYLKLFESKRKQTCRCESYNSCDFVRARGNSWLQIC